MTTKLIKTLAITAIAAFSALSSLATVTLYNPDFEDADLYPWANEDAATLSLNTDLSHVFTNLQSAQVDFPGRDGTGIHQDMPIDPSDRFQTYTVSFWVLAPGFTAPVGVRSCLWEFGPSGIVFNNGPWTFIPAGSTNWVQITAVISTTSGDAGTFRAVCQIAPQGSPKVSGSLWVDDASVTLVPVPSTSELTWVGGLAANAWDFVTINWLDTVLSTPSRYTNSGLVHFTDSGNNTSPILLTGTLSPATVNVESSINYSFSGSGKISGGATLNKLGTGVLTVANTGNDYTNNTVVATGTLQLGANEVIPDGAGKGNVILGGTLDLNGHNETVNNLTGSGTVDNSSPNNSSLTINSLSDNPYNGPIGNSGGGLLTLIKSGPGMLVKGGGPDSFAGQTIINGGRILLQDVTFFGSGSVTISNNCYLMLWGTLGSGVITNDFYLYTVGGSQGGSAKNSIFMDSGAGAMQLTGTIHLMNTSDLGAYDTELLTVSGKVTGPGALWKSNPEMLGYGPQFRSGSVILSNPANDFAGGVVVYGGTLEIQSNGAAGTGDALVWTNATLQLDSSAALNPAAKLSLADTSSTVNLAFTGTQNIHALSFDGGATLQVAGSWGAVGSAAVNQDAHFTGTGILNVATGGVVPHPVINPVAFDSTGTNLIISVSSVSGHQYRLWSATNLSAPVFWTPVATNSGTGGTLTNLVPVLKSVHSMFYRYQVD